MYCIALNVRCLSCFLCIPLPIYCTAIISEETVKSLRSPRPHPSLFMYAKYPKLWLLIEQEQISPIACTTLLALAGEDLEGIKLVMKPSRTFKCVDEMSVPHFRINAVEKYGVSVGHQELLKFKQETRQSCKYVFWTFSPSCNAILNNKLTLCL